MHGGAGNLELKARCEDLLGARQRVLELGAKSDAVLFQLDTYFRVRFGRLKLREINRESAELIAYVRPDRPEERISRYMRVPVPDPESMKRALDSSLGTIAVVRKRRQVLLWENVRIHLDQVENLGNFVEFEAVLSSSEDQAESMARLQRLVQALRITPDERVAQSYEGLMQSKTTLS